jgi:hypothetical protein
MDIIFLQGYDKEEIKKEVRRLLASYQESKHLLQFWLNFKRK